MVGIAWQNVWTARSGLAAILLVGASKAPEVPSEMNAVPGLIAPMPMAPAGLSPPPPAIIGGLIMPHRCASSLRNVAAGAQPPTSRGMRCRDKPAAARATPDQSRHATSGER